MLVIATAKKNAKGIAFEDVKAIYVYEDEIRIKTKEDKELKFPIGVWLAIYN